MTQEFEQLSPEQAARIDAVCDRFERDWKSVPGGGPVPRVAGYLDGADGLERTVLIRELIALNEACRRRFLAEDGSTAEDTRIPEQSRHSEAGDAELPPGTLVGHYRILNRVGRGGMGIIHKAHDTQLDRPVALKFLAAGPTDDAQLLQRFQQEALTVSALNHPHICTTHARGDHEGRPYLVMEWIDGQTLRTLAAKGLSLEVLVPLVSQVARALQAAHAVGIVHRDVKPENIMVRADGIVKVLDFGLARRLPATMSSASAVVNTAPGVLVGTVRYMAPEQARADAADGPSDIFSLGVVLYELATGVHPFAAATERGCLEAIQFHDPKPPRLLNTALPASLEALILQMLAKPPRQRPSAGEVSAALDGIVGHLREPVRARRWRWPLAVAAILLVAVIAFVFRPTGTVPAPSSAPLSQGPQSSVRLVPASEPGQDLATSGQVEGVAFSKDGRFLAAGNMNGGVQLWDLQKNATLKKLWPGVAVRSVAFSPDGKLQAAGDMGNGRVYLLDLETGRDSFVSIGFGATVRAVAFTGRRTLAVGVSPWKKDDPPLVLLDVDAPEKVRKPAGHTKAVWTIAVAPAGTTFASSAADGTVRIWATDTAKLLHTIDLGPVTGVSPSVAIAPDGQTLAVGFETRVELYAWGRWETPERVVKGGAETIWAVAFAGPRQVITAGGKTELWDAHTQRKIATFGLYRGVAATDDGSRVALGSCDSKEHFVRLLELVPAKD